MKIDDQYRFEEKYRGQKEKLPGREQEREAKIEKNINGLNATLTELEQQKNTTARQVSKMEELIEQDYQKLDTNTKNFMDAIKMLARNIFYLTFGIFHIPVRVSRLPMAILLNVVYIIREEED